MIVVIFEVYPHAHGKADYLAVAAELRALLLQADGLISAERFESLSEQGKLLSLSFWRDEAAVANWRNELMHRQAQQRGRASLFSHYRIRVGEIGRDYSIDQRAQAPEDRDHS
ncbi:antibiotic biosynthesis monooxygenase [Ferrimonas pelagia]|uniref:Antibiotic biosynthesis monooxygenase n=1 Tax=Ferrimonas pelagia TaxID=1177826 RepID=A0ABP9EXY3_9GAMM